MLDILLVLAVIGSNLGWWLYVRHLSGVTSDLKDVVTDVQGAATKVTAAAATIKTATSK